MKKQIAMLLYAAVLTLGLTVGPVMASADPYSPVEVETYTYGPFDELRINKVYRLSVSDDPSSIPTEDFEHGGRRYSLLGMVVDDTDSDMITYTAIFGSVELTGSGASGQYGFRPFDVDSFRKGTDADLLPLFICADCAVMAAIIVFCSDKAKQRRFKRRLLHLFHHDIPADW